LLLFGVFCDVKNVNRSFDSGNAVNGSLALPFFLVFVGI